MNIHEILGRSRCWGKTNQLDFVSDPQIQEFVFTVTVNMS